MVDSIEEKLAALSNAAQAEFLQRYFKTGPGEYGAGDVFRGIRVPALRKLAAGHGKLALTEVQELLRSRFHENRLLALLILVRKYQRGDQAEREVIYQLYLASTAFINNWDLVDCSAGYIVGPHLHGKGLEPLLRLAGSRSIWERRIAIMATSHFIKLGEFDATVALAERLLRDREDLIHKAVGWMLREVGKRNLAAEEAFLRLHHKEMPRTMLRYAIERFPEEKRRCYQKGTLQQ